MRPKVYLAGPDVFLPNAISHGVALRALCAEYGFEGVYPLDAPGPTTADLAAGSLAFGPDDARRIYQANVALIRGADAVMANLQNFRGYEPDSGTAFEVGFAAALGLPIWAYGAPSEPIVNQVPGDAAGIDADGYLIESFTLSRNLMLACSATIVDGDARACLAAMRASLLADAAGGEAESQAGSEAGSEAESPSRTISERASGRASESVSGRASTEDRNAAGAGVDHAHPAG